MPRLFVQAATSNAHKQHFVIHPELLSSTSAVPLFTHMDATYHRNLFTFSRVNGKRLKISEKYLRIVCYELTRY